jgi:hypothetical protein
MANPTFITEKDVDYWKQINQQFYTLFTKPLPIYKLKKSKQDPLYNDNPNQEFAEPYTLQGYVTDLPGWKYDISKFGGDSSRTLVAFFSPDLAAKEGKELPLEGDRVSIQDDLYMISQTNPADFGSNIQLNLSHVVILIRVRPQNPVQGTTIQKEY